MSDAKLTILGCGSAKPTKTTSPSAQLVELCDKSFLVDCGEGVLLTMQKLGWNLYTKQSICYSCNTQRAYDSKSYQTIVRN